MATEKFQYEPHILKRLQDVQLDLFKKFDEVCTRHNLTYFAVFGTAIGAIRHKGFIPWDDDIDLGMMREDYEKLSHIPKEEWGEDFLVFPEDNVPYHRTVIARLYRKNTIQQREKGVKYDKPRRNESVMRPIWLDIFVYSRVPDVETAKKYSRLLLQKQRLYWYAKAGMRVVKGDSLRFQIRCFRNDMIHKCLNIIPKPELRIYRSFYEVVKKLDETGGQYVTTFESDDADEMVKHCCLEKDMFPVVRVPFEDSSICIQKNYDEMLTNMYGDYMALPPEDRRFNHGVAILDFGDGKGNVIK